MRATAFTGEITITIVLAWCIVDGLIELTLGNEYTFSWFLLGVSVGRPFFAMGVTYTLTTLCGHGFLPHFGPPPAAWKEWAGIIWGLSPVLATLVFIAIHPDPGDVMKRAGDWMVRVEWRLYGILCLTSAYGLLIGKTCVSQHVY
jgi:hypothetical protein